MTILKERRKSWYQQSLPEYYTLCVKKIIILFVETQKRRHFSLNISYLLSLLFTYLHQIQDLTRKPNKNGLIVFVIFITSLVFGG